MDKHHHNTDKQINEKYPTGQGGTQRFYEFHAKHAGNAKFLSTQERKNINDFFLEAAARDNRLGNKLADRKCLY